MEKARVWRRGVKVVVLCCVVAATSTNAWARGEVDRHHRSRENVVVGHERYHYRDGHFFRPGWFGIEIALSLPPFGAVVTSIPTGTSVVIVGGTTYYCYDHVYYRHHSLGYIVVPAPVITQSVVTVSTPEPSAVAATAVVNVPNANGSYTAVPLTRQGQGYVGPQGEYYPEHPTVEQLKVLYGK
jgi:hypothetical protein